MTLRVTATTVLALLSVCCSMAGATDSPQASARTHAQNYNDLVLATCIATAYRDEKQAAADAGSSVSALRDWTYYDLEKAPDEIRDLVDQFLSRDYHNPLAEPEAPGTRFDLLKCLDLFHSDELEQQTKRLVVDPQHAVVQERGEPQVPDGR